VSDPYRWLENDTADDTKDWVKRENAVTNAYLAKIPFRDEIKQRLTELWNYEKYSAPFREGDYTYFLKTTACKIKVCYTARKVMSNLKYF